jgi:peptidoglycan-associated lipoprotein
MGQQCGPAHTCIKAPGWCDTEADCAWSEVCKDHKCMACTSDSECGPGAHCRAGKCIRPGFCQTDEDCPEDQDCKNNRCIKPGGATGDLPKCPLEPVYFGFDVFALTDESKAILQKNFDCLQANKQRKVAVVGNTDPRGTVEYNIGLSDDRAQAVITYLGRLGVDPGRMHKVPKGSSEAKGVDDASWTKDRRVEFVWE